MTNLDDTMELTVSAMKNAFAWAYDFDSKEWMPDKSIAGAYLGLSVAYLVIIGALFAGVLGLLGLSQLSLAVFSNPVSLLPLIGVGLVGLIVGGFIAYLVIAFFQVKFFTSALTREGFKPTVTGVQGALDFVIMQVLTALAILFSAFNPIGQGVLVLMLIVFILGALTASKILLLFGVFVGMIYVFIAAYNSLRGSWATLHWFARGGGKRDALRASWEFMGGRTLKSFLVMFSAGIVTAIALWVAFIPLHLLSWLVGLFPGGKLLDVVIRAVELPAQALTGAFMASRVYAALSTEALGKLKPAKTKR